MAPANAQFVPCGNIYAVYASKVPFNRLASLSASIEGGAVIVTCRGQSDSITGFLGPKLGASAAVKIEKNVATYQIDNFATCSYLKEALQLLCDHL